jgi:rhomboid protease GluP
MVERALRPVGGVVPLLISANALAALLVAFAEVRLIRMDHPDADSPAGLFVGGILSPAGGVLIRAGSIIPELVLKDGQAWRLLTAVFLHFGLFHIGVNMMSLRNIGGLVEEAYGSGKALALYLFTGLAGSVAGIAWYLLEPHLGMVQAPYNGAGASGAICGYAGLIAALGFRIGGEQGKALWKPMVKAVGFIFVLGLILEFTHASFRLGNSAHLGGFASGFAAGWFCTFGIRARGNPVAVKAWDAAAVVLSLLTVASFVPPVLGLLAR